jgi:predicted  nucleic acid-binding Zn-ribbon protein
MHKNNAQLFLQKLKDKLPKKTNKRTFQKIVLENDKYTIEETDQALEGCFLTIRLIPQEEIASIQVFIEELPESLVSKLENVLKQKKGFKL